MQLAGIVHVNVNCSEFDRSLAFYRMLGFELLTMVPATNTAAVAAAVGMPPTRFVCFRDPDGTILELVGV